MRLQLPSILVIGLISQAAFIGSVAMAAPQSKADLCALAAKPGSFQDMADHTENLNPIFNQGGLGGGGVCWWHSRLQRDSLYMAYYNPAAAKPNAEQAKEILKNIRKAKAFVEIPGYNNFSEFAADNAVTIQKFLNDWQVNNGILGFGFLSGTQDVSDDVSAESLPERMQLLFKQVNDEKRITYQLVQTSGFDSHAWLVTKMSKTEDGYELRIVDSNLPQEPYAVRYYEGAANIATPYGRIKTFTQQSSELSTISKTYEKECGVKLWENKAEKESAIIRRIQDAKETAKVK
jgi:hypothetical protein